MSNLSVENVYNRQEAKELTKKYFWKLLGMVAIAFGIPYALLMGGSTATSLLGADNPLFAIFTLLLMVVIMVPMCGLMLGLMSAVIDLCKGNENVTVGSVFSRMGQSLKCFGLSTWVGLKVFLWMLPGYALVIVGIVASVGSNNNASTMSESSAMMMGLGAIVGMILIFVLAFPAAFRYMLSVYILADKPETGVFDCVKQSKAMMKGHKAQAFKLVIPIMLVMYVLMMVPNMVFAVLLNMAGTAAASAVFSILMLVIELALMLYFSIRMQLCYALFYLRRSQGPAPVEAFPEADAAPVQESIE